MLQPWRFGTAIVFRVCLFGLPSHPNLYDIFTSGLPESSVFLHALA
jgi:hypothetical protein